MKITVLLENSRCREDLHCEHGLSLFIETGDKQILFDAGQTAAFADNAETLSIDLSKVDFAVLSHGHYDHGGGLPRFLEINPHAPVYLRPEAMGGYHNASGSYIGLSTCLSDSGRLVFTRSVHPIVPGITIYAPAAPVYPIDSAGLTRREGGKLLPDDFRHEQYLLIETQGKRILFSGCSHRGILNVAAQFQPDVLIGGFHLMKQEDLQQLHATAKHLLQSPTVYYTGHCTGQMQYDYLKGIMGNRLHSLSTGSVIEL